MGLAAELAHMCSAKRANLLTPVFGSGVCEAYLRAVHGGEVTAIASLIIVALRLARLALLSITLSIAPSVVLVTTTVAPAFVIAVLALGFSATAFAPTLDTAEAWVVEASCPKGW
jgi:hypothetical protein